MDNPLSFIVDKVDRNFPDYNDEEKLRLSRELSEVFAMALLHKKIPIMGVISDKTGPMEERVGIIRYDWQPCQPRGCNLCKQYAKETNGLKDSHGTDTKDV